MCNSKSGKFLIHKDYGFIMFRKNLIFVKNPQHAKKSEMSVDNLKFTNELSVSQIPGALRGAARGPWNAKGKLRKINKSNNYFHNL